MENLTEFQIAVLTIFIFIFNAALAYLMADTIAKCYNVIKKDLRAKWQRFKDTFKYHYHITLLRKPSMRVSEIYMFRKGDVVRFLDKDGNLKYARIDVIIDQEIIFNEKPKIE